MKLKAAVAASLLGIFSLLAFGQSGSVAGQPFTLLDRSKPSVYLSFVAETITDEDCSLKRRPAYRLALHNNTSRPINVPATYSARSPTLALRLNDGTSIIGLPQNTKVRLCYDVEAVPSFTSNVNNNGIHMEIPVRRAVPENVFYCSCAFEQQETRRNDYVGLWVTSGSSILFDIPKEYFDAGLKIFTIYNYEWEFTAGHLRNNEPRHQVYFYYSDVPRR